MARAGDEPVVASLQIFKRERKDYKGETTRSISVPPVAQFQVRHHFLKGFKREAVGGFKGRVCCCVWGSPIGFRHEQTSRLTLMNLPMGAKLNL